MTPTYFKWTQATLDNLNIIAHLNQPLDKVINPDFIPSDDDPFFAERLRDLESPKIPIYTIFDVLSRVYQNEDYGTAILLRRMITQAIPNTSMFLKDTPHLSWCLYTTYKDHWSMGVPKQKHRAVHDQCFTIYDTRKMTGRGKVHSICGRAYAPFFLSSDPEAPGKSVMSPEEESRVHIAQDVAMICSQVATTIKSTKRIADHEGLVWGMYGTQFYIVRSCFDAAYIEAVRTRPVPLPPSYNTEVHRTAFHDVRTVEGRREALRGLIGLLRYIEWRHQESEGP